MFVAYTGPVGVPQRRWMGVLVTFSALEVHGLQGYDKPRTEVPVAANRKPGTPSGIAIRRSVVLTRRDIALQSLPPATVAARSVIDAAQWTRDDREAAAVIGASFQQRIVQGDEVHAMPARMRGVRRDT